MTDERPPFDDTERIAPGFAGRFADGRTAAMHDVHVLPEGVGLRIVVSDGETLAEWPYDKLRLIDRTAPEDPLRFMLEGGGLARLQVADEAILEQLAPLAPDLRRSGVRDPSQWKRAAVWTVALVALFGGVWLALSHSAPLIAAMLPLSMEERMGRATVEQVSIIFGGLKRSDDLTCSNEAGVEAMQALTARLKAVDNSRYDFNVRVLDIPVPNAFAAPGGYIVFFRGLIDMAESPSEIAGVLGHEMTHVTHRHVTTNMIRSIGFQAFIVPLISGGTMASDMLSGLGRQALQASYTREAEADADLGAVELLRKADIKPDSFTDLLTRIEKKYGRHAAGQEDGADKSGNEDKPKGLQLSIPDILASHPATPDRAASVAAAAAGSDGGPGLTQKQWTALKSICAGS